MISELVLVINVCIPFIDVNSASLLVLSSSDSTSSKSSTGVIFKTFKIYFNSASFKTNIEDLISPWDPKLLTEMLFILKS